MRLDSPFWCGLSAQTEILRRILLENRTESIFSQIIAFEKPKRNIFRRNSIYFECFPKRFSVINVRRVADNWFAYVSQQPLLLVTDSDTFHIAASFFRAKLLVSTTLLMCEMCKCGLQREISPENQ